jgi:hypothetical protein
MFFAPGPVGGPLSKKIMAEHDRAVNITAEDAAGAKKSASELGYFDDQFIKSVFDFFSHCDASVCNVTTIAAAGISIPLSHRTDHL